MADMVERAARYELEVLAFKCKEVLKAYPDGATERMRLQFSQGLGRELWWAMNSIGMLLTAQRNVEKPQQLPTDGLLGALLDKIEWRGLHIVIDILQLDRQQLLQVYADAEGATDRVDSSTPLIGPRWWLWPSEGPEAEERPAWWNDPKIAVARPMPVWLHDRIDVGDKVADIFAIATNRVLEVQSMEKMEKMYRRDATGALAAQLDPEGDSNMDGKNGEGLEETGFGSTEMKLHKPFSVSGNIPETSSFPTPGTPRKQL
ncbi:hypothetical protein LXA43DRAFT_1064229 [Ganoderma leucocontextum]|nr:hypothetical protein LXA43DRAFT_1064229 [Ganoderma leucocontextum]